MVPAYLARLHQALNEFTAEQRATEPRSHRRQALVIGDPALCASLLHTVDAVQHVASELDGGMLTDEALACMGATLSPLAEQGDDTTAPLGVTRTVSVQEHWQAQEITTRRTVHRINLWLQACPISIPSEPAVSDDRESIGSNSSSGSRDVDESEWADATFYLLLYDSAAPAQVAAMTALLPRLVQWRRRAQQRDTEEHMQRMRTAGDLHGFCWLLTTGEEQAPDLVDLARAQNIKMDRLCVDSPRSVDALCARMLLLVLECANPKRRPSPPVLAAPGQPGDPWSRPPPPPDTLLSASLTCTIPWWRFFCLLSPSPSLPSPSPSPPPPPPPKPSGIDALDLDEQDFAHPT